MAIGSVLTPETIVGRQNKSPIAAQNFISGGAPIGSSVINSAANKIVGFERATVKPISPDFNNIIGTITNNILNSVDSSIKNATNFLNQKVDNNIQNLTTQVYNQIRQTKSASPVTQLQTVVQNIQSQATASIQKTVADLSSNYQERIKKIDSAKPSGILEKFLSNYKNALSFIQFFSNKKNLKSLSDSLLSLKKSFTDSFEVVKLIRQVIQKIVSQLTSLPKSTPGGGGGINLDVNVPGSGLKRSAPGGLSNMFKGKGKMLALGAGVLGAGAVGTGAVNALSDTDRLQPGLFKTDFMGNLLDPFTSIIERFSDAVNEMFNIGKSSGNKGGGGGAPSSSPGRGPGGGPSGSPTSGSGNKTPIDLSKISGDTPEQKAFLATVGSTEAGTYNTIVGGQQIPELTQMTIQEVYDLGMKNKVGEGTMPQRFGGRKIKFPASSHAMGRYQFIPKTMMGAMKSAGLKPTDLYSPENQDKMALAFATSIGINVNRPMTESDFKKSGSSVAWEGMRKISYAEAKKRYNQYLIKAQTTNKGVGGPDLPDFMLPPEKKQQYQNLATSVSQPPPSQQTPQINFLPMSMGGGMPSRPQSSGGGSVSAPPAPAQDSVISVPNIPSGNPDNFLILYSKMVYNIVDG